MDQQKPTCKALAQERTIKYQEKDGMKLADTIVPTDVYIKINKINKGF